MRPSIIKLLEKADHLIWVTDTVLWIVRDTRPCLPTLQALERALKRQETAS